MGTQDDRFLGTDWWRHVQGSNDTAVVLRTMNRSVQTTPSNPYLDADLSEVTERLVIQAFTMTMTAGTGVATLQAVSEATTPTTPSPITIARCGGVAGATNSWSGGTIDLPVAYRIELVTPASTTCNLTICGFRAHHGKTDAPTGSDALKTTATQG